MRYLRIYENFEKSEIEEECQRLRLKNYKINPDNSVDIEGSVVLRNILSSFDNHLESLVKVPIKFNRVEGSFICEYCGLKTLENTPNYVGDNFNCFSNKLTSLKGGPEYVEHNYICNGNYLKDLYGFPENYKGKYEGGIFSASLNIEDNINIFNPVIEILELCPKEKKNSIHSIVE